MAKIKIVATPPGFAPLDIREQWVDIEIPLAPIEFSDDSLKRIGDENVGGYQVAALDAIEALEKSGKTEAAKFWKEFKFGNLVFKKEVCELIE